MKQTPVNRIEVKNSILSFNTRRFAPHVLLIAHCQYARKSRCAIGCSVYFCRICAVIEEIQKQKTRPTFYQTGPACS